MGAVQRLHELGALGALTPQDRAQLEATIVSGMLAPVLSVWIATTNPAQAWGVGIVVGIVLVAVWCAIASLVVMLGGRFE